MKQFKLKSKKNGFWMYRPKYKLQKVMWEFNPYDNDTNPHLSIPHGDNYYPQYHTLKLNVDNGYIFTSKHREFVGKVSKKELKRLHCDPKFQKVKEEALKYRDGSRIVTFVNSSTEVYIFELETTMFLKNKNISRRKS